MPLTLSDPETDRLARSLATLTGETLEQAVGRAIKDRLLREQERRGAAPAVAGSDHGGVMDDALLREVHAIARRFREHAGVTFSSLDHGELLYDEAGLPR
jgi:antitoxin VapB